MPTAKINLNASYDSFAFEKNKTEKNGEKKRERKKITCKNEALGHDKRIGPGHQVYHTQSESNMYTINEPKHINAWLRMCKYFSFSNVNTIYSFFFLLSTQLFVDFKLFVCYFSRFIFYRFKLCRLCVCVNICSTNICVYHFMFDFHLFC